MHVLVDQNGYELLNTGDLAMLETGLARVDHAWPQAQVSVACHAPGRLMQATDSAEALGFRFAEMPSLQFLPRRVRLGAEQAYKALSPLAPVSLRGVPIASSRSIRQAVRDADCVIGTGGGYVCDDFWWHGAGVLATLDAAQRRGIPTAMFGQGLGPLTYRPLRALAARVLGRLDVLTLRDKRHSVEVLADLGALGIASTSAPAIGSPGQLRGGGEVRITGDEALGAIRSRSTSWSKPRPASLIGVTIRSSSHTSLGDDLVQQLGNTIRAAARRHGADLMALPVSHYADADDLATTAAALSASSETDGLQVHTKDLPTVSTLAAAAGRCRVVVTASYHAGLFALAAGVPVIGLSATPYYHDKLTGLIDLYPDLVQVIPLGQAGASERLAHLIDQAWALDDDRRAAARHTTEALVDDADRAFGTFANRVEAARRKDG